jgi:N-acetylneuraminate lyase
MEKEFKGIWPAMFTPVNEKGEPDFDDLEKLIELLISQAMDGLYILGSTGQGVLFTEQQRKQTIEVVCKIVAGRLPIIAQVGALTTEESVRLAKYSQKQGVSGISSVGPIYYSYTADMALAHYRTIAQSTDLPFFPYQLGDNSMPGDTVDFVKKLLDIPHVTGMKLTTSQLLDISLIHNYAGDRLKLFSGIDELFCHALLCGTVGAIGSTYNIWGVECKHVMEEFIKGNYQLTKDFMLCFQGVIQYILPNIWPFMRKAMLLKYDIDIGHAKAPLGNTHRKWKDQEVYSLMEKVESVVENRVKK